MVSFSVYASVCISLSYGVSHNNFTEINVTAGSPTVKPFAKGQCDNILNAMREFAKRSAITGSA